jgi:hypothetical protein
VKSFSIDRKFLIIEKDSSDWKIGIDPMSKHFCLAFYIDGDLSQLPITGTHNYRISSKTDDIIELQSPFPDNIAIKPGITKVRLHLAGQSTEMLPTSLR